jgi:BirA family biotin operon repressor/biotin-[acetyl-CoA-carboxylase] ligase
MSLKHLTNINCFLIKKILSRHYKKKISIKPPNDLLINKKKICGILQETLKKSNITYFIVGVGINLVKNPYIKKYPTTNLLKLTKIKTNKTKIFLEIKNLYEEFINQFTKFNIKTIKNL